MFAFLLFAAAAMPSSPDLGKAEGRCRAGEQGPADIDPRSKPFPLPKLPLSYNLEKLHGWVSSAGIPMWSQPSAKNSMRTPRFCATSLKNCDWSSGR